MTEPTSAEGIPDQWVVVVWSGGDIDEILGPYSSEEEAESCGNAKSRRDLGYGISVHRISRRGWWYEGRSPP